MYNLNIHISLLSFVCLTYIKGYLHNSSIEMDTVKVYMEKYQYYGEMNPDPDMKRNLGENKEAEALRLAIITYQRIWGLPETGDINDATWSMMQIARCGLPDIHTMEDVDNPGIDEDGGYNITSSVGSSERHGKQRTKRYKLSEYWFQHLNISYKIISYPQNGPDGNTVEKVIGKAFLAWQEVSKLTFVQADANSVADILISFKPGNHQDYEKQGVLHDLAHAFYPNRYYSGSQIHFNDDHIWTEGPNNVPGEYNLYQVALHEIGHAIGLAHELKNNKSIMNPYYDDRSAIVLNIDDINGVNTLYNDPVGDDSPMQEGVREMSMNVEPMMRDFCTNSTIDAAVLRKEGGKEYIYLFKGKTYIRMINGMVEAGYPKYIKDNWPGLPDNIEASSNDEQFNTETNQTLRFVKDGKMYIVRGQEVVDISDIRTPKIKHRDAIFTYPVTGGVYELEGPYLLQSRRRGFKRYLRKNFIPALNDTPITAACNLDRFTSYFFSGLQYFIIDTTTPFPKLKGTSPKDISKDFLRCGDFKMMMAVTIDTNYTSSNYSVTTFEQTTLDEDIVTLEPSQTSGTNSCFNSMMASFNFGFISLLKHFMR